MNTTVGQVVEVRLEGLRVRTGWETTKVSGPLESTGQEFIPMVEAPDKAMGTYVFKYKASIAGEVTLSFEYITPGGPEVKARMRSALVDQFKVTVDVKDAPRRRQPHRHRRRRRQQNLHASEEMLNGQCSIFNQ